MSNSLTAAEHARAMGVYVRESLRRAQRIGNRGPVRFDADGHLHPDIVAAYWRHGFYVFEQVLRDAEVDALRRDVLHVLDRAPVAPGAVVDRYGNPAIGIDMQRNPYALAKPLADPWGGTSASAGRHPSKMAEPAPAGDVPDHVVLIIAGMCQLMESGLRVYGHPQLLAIAEAINGPDFVPYNDAIFIKQPGLGSSVAWHQDGVTHWDDPAWDEGIHGVNFQAQLNRTTARSCLWVVPGTHQLGRVDIAAMVERNGGSDRLPEAIPLACEPGDVTIVNRQTLHASFANTSDDFRISVSWGFHRRAAVLGQHGHLMQPAHVIYDEEFVDKRADVIQVAIDARSQVYADETPFVYRPRQHVADRLRWNPDTFEKVIRDYNTRDIAI